MTPVAGQGGRVMTLRWGGWCLILACVFARAMAGVETLPCWDGDPTRMVPVLSGLTPAASQAIDVCIMAATGVVMLGEVLAGTGVMFGWAGLVFAGTAGVCMHAFVIHSGDLEHMRLGSTWIAAMFAGLAGMHACRDQGLRRVTLAAVFGLVMMLTAKGALQVMVEHRQTWDTYRRDPEAFLQSQGWSKDSAAARTFERRLRQPEATGWFGLANVFATFAAAGLIALTGWSIAGWRRIRDNEAPLADGWAALLSLGAIAAAVALWMAGSKGGLTVAGIGLSLLAGRMLLERQVARAQLWRLTSRVAGLLAIALVVSAVGALLLRGVLGTRMGELSLLFRWYYVEAATRVLLSHPITGVGPAGFKDAYMLAKPALSPEEVQSPHSVMFDYAATLGVFGLAWVAVFVGWVYRLGVALVAGPESGLVSTATSRQERWGVVLLACLPTIVGAFIELPIGTPESAAARMIGLSAWIGVGFAVLELLRCDANVRWVAALAALAVAVHAQIEVTPVWGGSACLAMVLVSAAGAGAGRGARGLGAFAAVAALAIAAAWAVLGLRPMVSWERGLRDAAAMVAPAARINERTTAVASAGGKTADGDTMERISSDLGQMLGQAAPRNPVEFDGAFATLLATRAEAAADRLAATASDTRRHLPTQDAICRAYLLAAQAQGKLGHQDRADALAQRAADVAKATTSWEPRSPSAFSLLGTTLATWAELSTDPAQRRRNLEAAIEAWTAAAALDPFGLTFPLRIFKTELDLGRRDRARVWAERVLRADESQRLDPLKRLTSKEREEVEGILKPP